MCASGDWICHASVFWAEIVAGLGWAWTEVLRFGAIGWGLLQPHTQFIAAIFGAAMFAWKWYDRRDVIVFGRIAKLLGDQGEKVRRASARTVELIIRPAPSPKPLEPAFAVAPLLRVLKREGFGSFLGYASATKAAKQLSYAHGLLDRKTQATDDYVRLIREQRFSAFMLEGALASARGARTTDPAIRSRNFQTALERFIEAANVPGRTLDATTRELVARHKFLCGQNDLAAGDLGGLQDDVIKLVSSDTFSTARERDAALARLIRVVRYRAEIKHAELNYVVANQVCIELTGNANNVPHPAMGATLTHRHLLDRAEFHAFHCAVRVHMLNGGPTPIPTTGVARQSFIASQQDFSKLLRDLSVSRWTRLFGFFFARKSSKARNALVRDARSGLQRLETLETTGRCTLC